jgi:hypothetical protein
MSTLQEQLDKEKQAKANEQKPTPEVISAKQKLENANLELDAIRKQQEVDSATLGYANFKEREKSFADRESELIKGTNQLVDDRAKFTKEREDFLARYEVHKKEYDTLMAAIKTREDEAKRIMTEAISKKSEAEKIIKHQTEAEKVNQEKQEAYADNMDDSLKLFGEIIQVLRKQEDGRILNMAVALNSDFYLIQWLQYKKAGLQTLADIVAVDCDRITELCEYLQDSKKDYSVVLKYLLDSTEWLSNALCIKWSPTEEIMPS